MNMTTFRKLLVVSLTLGLFLAVSGCEAHGGIAADPGYSHGVVVVGD